jgi:hypothetical protein
MPSTKTFIVLLSIFVLASSSASCAQSAASPPAPSPVPFPVTSHPRLWITQSDLPRLRSWATSSNRIYDQGMLPILNQAVSIYNSQFFPNGAANPIPATRKVTKAISRSSTVSFLRSTP